jgi:penicillin-binding protein 1C
VAIDNRNGKTATTATPQAFIEVRPYVDLPPRYAEWAATAGFERPPETLEARGEATHSLRLETQRVRLAVTAPENGLRLLRDPETPVENATLALKALADPAVPQLVWYVDGKPFQLVEYPYTARWPAQPGTHVFQARLPQTTIASVQVRVTVQ